VSGDLERWRTWIGRSRETEDTIDLGRARAMQATLGDPGAPLGPGDPLPPLWHWLYFWTLAPASALGAEGHPARGGFLPPIEAPRRMWAGGRLRFLKPLPLGANARHRAEVADVRLKQGRSGPLAFVTVRHQVATSDGPCIEEAQDLVFRDQPRAGETARPGEPAPEDAPWRRALAPDPVLLFRYSALTFNGHRIHYDLKFATEDEGYPGLVVHGPLLATLMVELVRRARPEARVAAFEFRAERPVFDTAPFMVAGEPAPDGKGAELWVADAQGCYASRGRVELE
jgi:3-methylfumaryl-CoA hydratase